jgi:tRNA (cytosine38-C5)-methyltransferase
MLIDSKPRFFTPDEILKLHDFPSWFEFPESVSNKQRWRLLGNSLNVEVVGVLLKGLLC